MYRTSSGWITQYRVKDALWLYNNNPKFPHAELTSGLHSSGFFNSEKVIPDTALLAYAASDLVELLDLGNSSLLKIDGVVGPQKGGTELARKLSETVANASGRPCFYISPKIVRQGGTKSAVFTEEEKRLLRGRNILPCDDVLTTGESAGLVEKAIEECGGKVLPYYLVLVNRSGHSTIAGKKIFALINRHMPTWKADECPLCRKGSKALRPKDNWKELNSIIMQ